jgi:hypothetical protein
MKLRLALLMMQKNEATLLAPWIRYHSKLTASRSIFIFDNGSTDPDVLRTLSQAEEADIQIVRHHSRPEDYLNAGNIFSQFIQYLDAENPHDFYFPIDCDEFLACQTKSGPSCRSEDIEEQLTALLGSEQVLVIPHKYNANPYQRNHYIKTAYAQKCFFGQGTCHSLSHGFHEATTKAGQGQRITSITYFEFHHKPYQERQRLAAQKIIPIFNGKELSRRNLAEYAATLKTNFHCALELLQTEYDYVRSLATNSSHGVHSCLLELFAELHIDANPLFIDSPLISKRSTLLLMARHGLTKIADTFDYHRFRALATKIRASLLPKSTQR